MRLKSDTAGGLTVRALHGMRPFFFALLAMAGTVLSAQNLQSQTGYIRLHWQNVRLPGEYRVTLRSLDSVKEPGRILYSGENPDVFVSGLGDGAYLIELFQVGSPDAVDQQVLQVAHHGWYSTLFFLCSGAALLIFLLLFMIYCHWRIPGKSLEGPKEGNYRS
ncbi:MAG: hypothetical protein HS115_17990 [Spirochaetales bacterium]|nr:hypothetical protein [Spirochaetales bacterium]